MRELFVRRFEILEKKEKFTLLAKDLLNDSIKKIHLSGKQAMFYINLEKGMEIYAIGAKTGAEEKWRLLTQTDCKRNQEWYALKIAFEEEVKALGIRWEKNTFL